MPSCICGCSPRPNTNNKAEVIIACHPEPCLSPVKHWQNSNKGLKKQHLARQGRQRTRQGKLHSSSFCCAAAEILRRVREVECAVFCNQASGSPRASPRLSLESSEESYTDGMATETSQEQGNGNCRSLSFPPPPKP